MVFEDRAAAGRILAEWLLYLRGHDPVVVGVANAGAVVAKEIAVALDAPLDVLVVRKLLVPGAEELTMGAVGEGAVIASNHEVMRECGITPRALAKVAHQEHYAVTRQLAMLHRTVPPPELSGRVVVLVDDGVTTGATIRVAIRVLRARGVSRVILAVPVAPAAVLRELDHAVDQLICPKAMPAVRNLDAWYRDFPTVTADKVAAILRAHTVLTHQPGA